MESALTLLLKQAMATTPEELAQTEMNFREAKCLEQAKVNESIQSRLIREHGSWDNYLTDRGEAICNQIRRQ